MRNKYLKLVFSSWLMILVLLGSLLSLQPSQASTTELQNQLNTAGNKAWGIQASPTSLAQIIQYAVQAFLGLLGIIFIILIIYAGYSWLVAGDNEDKVNSAKQTLTRAVIGLIIVVAAYAITYFVFSSLPAGGGGLIVSP